MPRWPRGLHPQTIRNTGQRSYAIPRNEINFYGSPFTVDLDESSTVVLNSAGSGFTSLFVVGWGVHWRVSQAQVSTTTGTQDTSQCVLYRTAVVQNRIIGQTAQGGGDTLNWDLDLDIGESVIAFWTGGNPGDTATLALRGEKLALG